MTRRWISNMGYVRQDLDATVHEKAQQRMRSLFALDLPIVVCFSGGKDSTVIVGLMYDLAEELDRLPLDVCVIDEEVIDPDTIRHTFHVSQKEGIRFHWLCVPVRHTLKSQLRSCWYPWEDRFEDVWAQNNEEECEAFVTAIAKAIEWTEDNQSAARRIVAEYTGIPYKAVPEYHFTDRGRVRPADITFWMDYLKERGDIAGDTWVTPEMVGTDKYNK